MLTHAIGPSAPRNHLYKRAFPRPFPSPLSCYDKKNLVHRSLLELQPLAGTKRESFV